MKSRTVQVMIELDTDATVNHIKTFYANYFPVNITGKVVQVQANVIQSTKKKAK